MVHSDNSFFKVMNELFWRSIIRYVKLIRTTVNIDEIIIICISFFTSLQISWPHIVSTVVHTKYLSIFDFK